MSRERCPTCKRALPRPIPKARKKPRRVSVNRDPGYRRFLRGIRCVLCPCFTEHDTDEVTCGCSGPIDPAHTAHNNGLSSKGPDSSCVPLCRKHHEEFDAARNAAGRAAFDAKYDVNMKQVAAAHYQRYLKEKEK